MNECITNGNSDKVDNDDVFLGQSADGTITYRRLTPATLNDAIRVLNVAFYPFEPLCTALKITDSPMAIDDLNVLFSDMSQDFISMVAMETSSNRVIGACFNKIEIKQEDDELDFYEVFKKKKCKEDRVKFFIDFMSTDETGIDIFEQYNTDTIVDLVCLTVLPEFRRRGIARDLMMQSLKLIQSTTTATAACIICSSSHTLHIAKGFGFTELFSIPYEQCSYDGEKFSDVITDHSRVVLVGRQL